MTKKNYRKIRAHQYPQYRYIIMDGEIFINAEAKEPTILAKFIWTTKKERVRRGGMK